MLVVGEINNERVEQLKTVVDEALPGTPSLEAVIDAMVMPLAKRTVGSDPNSQRCVHGMQFFFDKPLAERSKIHSDQMEAVYTHFESVLKRCMPEMPGQEISSRLFIGMGALLGAIARLDMVAVLDHDQSPEAVRWSMIHSLRDGLCGLFRAPICAGLNESIFIEESKKNRLVSMNMIAAITSSGNYTRVHFVGGGHSDVHRPLESWQQSLPEGKFLLIRRGCLVNRASIRRSFWNEKCHLELDMDCDSGSFICSRRQSGEVARALGF
jgi:hypothetical protein